MIEIKSLDGRVLRRADERTLRGARLAHANLAHTNMLAGIDLRDADLAHADLRGVNLSGANLSCARLTEVDLRGATLAGANLAYANLYYARLAGANLSRADLCYTDLKGATYGEGVLIGDHPLELSGLGRDVWVFKNHLLIGCQCFSFNEGVGMDEKVIVAFGSSVLEFWQQNRVLITAFVKSARPDWTTPATDAAAGAPT